MFTAVASDKNPATAKAPINLQSYLSDSTEKASAPQADIGPGGGAPAGLTVEPPIPLEGQTDKDRSNNSQEEDDADKQPPLSAPATHHVWVEEEL